MVDWRALGEVPDSEDEDNFDSQDNPQLPANKLETASNASHRIYKDDIWDVPSSQPQDELSRSRDARHTPKPTAASQAVVQGGLKKQNDLTANNDIWDVPSSDDEAIRSPTKTAQQACEAIAPSSASLRTRPQSRLPSRQSSPESLSSSQELPSIQKLAMGKIRCENRVQDLARENNAKHSENANEATLASNVGTPFGTPSLTVPGRASTPQQSQILGHDTEQEKAGLAAAIPQRSFRVRKLVQKFPFAMDEAQFNRTWKESGMRPIKLITANTDNMRHRQVGNDTEEEDFEPESQGSNARLEHSQVNDPEGLDSDPVISVAPSSPMQNSPLETRGGGGGPSSQTSGKAADTDNTSLDDDDLPTIQELVASKQRKKMRKQMRPPDAPPLPKRRRTHIPLDSSPLPRPLQLRERQESPDPLSIPVQSERPECQAGGRTELLSARNSICEERHSKASLEPLANNGDEVGEGQPGEAMINVISDDDDSSSHSTSSDSGSEVVTKNRSRIRGVLPASWLRMDQLAGRARLERKLQRPVHRSPDREMRRGVAQTRRAEMNTFANALIFSESEDDAPPEIDQRPMTADTVHIQPRLPLRALSSLNAPIVATQVLSDDEDSVIEEEQIDRMAAASGRKRQLKLSESFAQTAKRPKKSHEGPVPLGNKPIRQPKIAGAFSKHQARPASKTQSSRKRMVKTKRGGTRRPEVPALSVLDIIEPQAPRFLRIAARTARSRPEQGRASPTKKTIQLASRQDHMDAAQVLEDWKRGLMQQRGAVTEAKGFRKTYQPHSELPSASAIPASSRKPQNPSPRPDPAEPARESYKPIRTSLKNLSTRTKSNKSSGRVDKSAFRPAELQTEAPSFHTGMRFLEQIYHQGKRGAPTTSDIAPKELVKRRKRKVVKPQQIDTSAPQYSRANDPLPCAQTALLEQPTNVKQAQRDKLRGLGPYGTNYTHHFEVFPLAPGIYFHSSTLLGSGVLEKILHADYAQQLQESKPNAVYTLGQQTMRWSFWTDVVSSEMGIVVDHVCEQLGKPPEPDDPITPTSVSAADHLLTYVRSAITFDSAADIGSFLRRSVEVVQRFLDHLTAFKCQSSPIVFQVCDRLTLFTFAAFQICRSDSASDGLRMRLESLTRSLGVATARLLAPISVSELRQTYRTSQSTRASERGFRSDDYAIHSWTLLLRVLENARIPRGGFWDVITEAFLPPDLASNNDMLQQESAWAGFFTLLPLTDFTDSGVLIGGGRQRCATDGWVIPKKLLQRVFQIYQGNQQQGASFNSYFRALVARCHCLIQDWGWRRSSGIVGVIFDFFGSQGLRHLRNEEFDRSPNFLQELSRSPSLMLKPEDRCFHIFLKLLASSIKQLRQQGAQKDVRSLVTRTLPNHGRSYAKEQDIHPCDLAALRNHHDLLVTLFWAAPPNRRPQLELLERLVVPATSHKEACLINMRAWNQLACFITSAGVGGEHGEARELFYSLNHWRSRFFEQTIQQLDTVASDIRQQLLSLSTDISKSITPEMVDTMVSMNKSGIMDVVRLSMTASLDAMKHAPNLETASYTLSTSQLQRVFNSFSVSPAEMDWDILRIALTTLDNFLSRVDEFVSAQESQQSESQMLNNVLADDALLVLDEDVAGSCFKMARCVLASSAVRDTSARDAIDRGECTEHAIMLGAKLAAKLIGASAMTLLDLFTQGKYRLFGYPPQELDLSQRKLLTLFVTTLLKHDFDDFSTSAGMKLDKLYMLSIVKPAESLAFENILAEQLIRMKKPYVREPTTGFAISPDYETNCQLFEFAISHMHQLLRDADPSVKRDVALEQTQVLQLVMAQMRGDLQTVMGDGGKHRAYVAFVQKIISLIKTYGPSSCAVDDFFLRVGNEYWPDKNDPELQVAKMAAYGLRVMEGDSRTESQLFWLMFSRFKLAMMGNKLDSEAQLLAAGLREPGIAKFVIGNMLPAIVEATMQVSTEILLNVYAQGLDLFLDCEDLCFVLEEGDLPQIKAMLKSILRFFRIKGTSSPNLAPADLYVLRLLLDVMNMLWPSNYLFLLQGSPLATGELKSTLKDTAQFAAHIEMHLQARIQNEPELNWSELLGAAHVQEQDREPCAPVSTLTDLIVEDVRKTWRISSERVSVQTQQHATQSTQSAQGVKRPVFDHGALIQELYVGIKQWNTWWKKVSGQPEPVEEPYEIRLLF